MKKMLSLLLAISVLFTMSAFGVSAEDVVLSDELFEAIVAYKNYDDLEKSDVNLYYCDHIADDTYLVKYSIAGTGVTADMVRMEVGDYRLYSNRPLPLIFADGTIYEIEDAFELGVIDNSHLSIMSTFPQLNMVNKKITWELQQGVRRLDMEDYVNVRFTVEGSQKGLDDIENWIDDVHGSIEKLNAHYEEIHNRLVTNELKDYDHIDRFHNSGVSIVSIKLKDMETIAQSDFVTEMDYISDVHMKYIETFKPSLNEYIYEEKCAESDENGEPSYYLVHAHNAMGSEAVISFRFGEYIITSGAIYSNFTYGYGIYDIKEDKFYDVYDLKDTEEKYNRLEDHLAFFSRGVSITDTDGDLRTSVLDATNIQRYNAKLDHVHMETYISHKGGEYCYVGDVDNDGQVTVLDATAIQKIVAKYDI